MQFSLAAGPQLRAVVLLGPPACPGVCPVWMCGFERCPGASKRRGTAIAEQASVPGCRSQRAASFTTHDSRVRQAPTSQNERRGVERQGPAQGPWACGWQRRPADLSLHKSSCGFVPAPALPYLLSGGETIPESSERGLTSMK